MLEIKSISLGNELYKLIGIICNSSESDNYYTMIKMEDIWLNNSDFTELKNEYEIIKGVDLLFYKK